MKKAFTLIELLVVIAIIAILAAILFPVFAQAKIAAKKSVALSQSKQVGLAAHIYMADYDDVFVPYSYGVWGDHVSSPGGWGDFYGLMYWQMNLHPYIKNKDIHADPGGDWTNNPYAAWFNDEAPDPNNNTSSPAGMMRVSWCWNAMEVWDYAAQQDSSFDPNGKFGFVRTPGSYWDATPINASSVDDLSGTFWITEGIWSDIAGDADTDYGVKLRLPEDQQYWTSSTGQRHKGRRVRGRYQEGFHVVHGDTHAKYQKWGASQPSQWSTQSD